MGRKSREKRERKQGLWVVEEISQVTPALWQKLRMRLFHKGDLPWVNNNRITRYAIWFNPYTA